MENRRTIIKKNKKIFINTPGFFKQVIKKDKEYFLVRIDKNEKRRITPILCGADLARNVNNFLVVGKQYEIVRVRCMPGTHKLQISGIHAV